MEKCLIVKATTKEMKNAFDFDEVLNIRYFEKRGENEYYIRVRFPECNLTFRNKMKLSTLKEKVINACPEKFLFIAKATYENGKVKQFYAKNKYWSKEYSIQYEKMLNSKLINFQLEKRKLPC